uniref:Uncharacterized protein n=1 Tax=Tanacetum cinerariifolium TaxID=118510 RepID=A0A6L2MIZ6_TANCI|nr:hypothetical protein [Tanacetum cinerariifolium]
MPFAMLLTRLYNHILQTNPQAIVSLARFTFHEHVMDPLDILRNPSKEKRKSLSLPQLWIPCYNIDELKTLIYFWFTVKKVKKSSFYEFDLADKKFQVNVELFCKILCTCPRVPNEEFVDPPSEESLLTFLIELGYKGKGSKGKKATVTRKKKSSIIADDNIIPKPDPTSVKESDESNGEPANRPTGRRRPTAIKASKKISRRQLHTGGSSKGAGNTPEVPDESTYKLTTSSDGTGITLEVLDKVKGSFAAEADAAIDWGLENKNNDEYVVDDADEEIKDGDNAKNGKDDEEMTDAEKENAVKIEQAKDDHEQVGKEFAKVDQAKDIHAQDNQAYALAFVIQKEMSGIPPTNSMIFEQTILSTASPHAPNVTIITSMLQKTTPIPTLPITTAAPTVTTAILDPLPAIVQRLFDLENQFKAWKQVDHSKKHDRGDDKDKDPSARPYQGKNTKRRRTKETESSKKSSTSKETSKEVTMDAEENPTNDDVVNDSDQPLDDSVPNTNNAPKNNCFKQPPRPPTPDPKWNKC